MAVANTMTDNHSIQYTIIRRAKDKGWIRLESVIASRNNRKYPIRLYFLTKDGCSWLADQFESMEDIPESERNILHFALRTMSFPNVTYTMRPRQSYFLRMIFLHDAEVLTRQLLPFDERLRRILRQPEAEDMTMFQDPDAPIEDFNSDDGGQGNKQLFRNLFLSFCNPAQKFSEDEIREQQTEPENEIIKKKKEEERITSENPCKNIDIPFFPDAEFVPAKTFLDCLPTEQATLPKRKTFRSSALGILSSRSSFQPFVFYRLSKFGMAWVQQTEASVIDSARLYLTETGNGNQMGCRGILLYERDDHMTEFIKNKLQRGRPNGGIGNLGIPYDYLYSIPISAQGLEFLRELLQQTSSATESKIGFRTKILRDLFHHYGNDGNSSVFLPNFSQQGTTEELNPVFPLFLNDRNGKIPTYIGLDSDVRILAKLCEAVEGEAKGKDFVAIVNPWQKEIYQTLFPECICWDRRDLAEYAAGGETR